MEPNELRAWRNLDQIPLEFSDDPIALRLLEASQNSEPVEISYFGGSRPGTRRTVTPIELFRKSGHNGATYLNAYCHERKEERTFRLDRIDMESVPTAKKQYVAKRNHSSRSSGGYSYDAGREAARRHIEEANNFTREIGGTDADVKDYFFNMKSENLDQVLDEYGNKYGEKAENYARKTISSWRAGATQMSGLVAKRLFSLLPPRMPLAKKFELAENIWRHFGPSSSHSFTVGPNTNVSSIANVVSARFDADVTQYNIPTNVQNRFNWLAADDVSLKEQLLNHFRQLEKRLASEKIHAELPVLQRQVRESGEITGSVKSVIKIHKHEVAIHIDKSMGDQVRDGTPPVRTLDRAVPPQVKSMSRMWTWVMWAAAAGIVLLWATGK